MKNNLHCIIVFIFFSLGLLISIGCDINNDDENKDKKDPAAKISICGDGIADPGEECDDMNGDDNDGCDSSCIVEEGWICTGMPSVCTIK